MVSSERDFQVFVKPVGARCNLRCGYCYYRDKENLIDSESAFCMPADILEKYIIQHIEATTDKIINFSWHGGEPTLSGLEFFRRIVSLQEKHLPEGKTILNGIQTNATLIDDEWSRFLAESNFYIGVSIDGPESLHNKFRLNKEGQGSFSKVIIGYELLKKYGNKAEILTVVNSENVNSPVEVYRYLRELGTEFITFIPLVERYPGSVTGVSSRSVPAKAFGKFLCNIFDEWVAEDIGRIKIQIFEEAVRTAFNLEHTLCIFKKTCGGVPVIEQNGDFYSCDHFVDEEHYIGNIKFISIAEMLDCDTQVSFGEAKFSTLPKYCLDCEVMDMCNGECPKNRFLNTPAGESRLNYLCAGYKLFFNHIRPFVNAVNEEWKIQK
jgi:uncharacterized protein